MRDRRRAVLALFAAVLVAAGASGCSIGSGDKGDSGASELSKQEELRQAREQGARDARIKQLEKEVAGQKKGGGTNSNGGDSGNGNGGASAGGGGGGNSSCGGGLSVGPNTSCAFAHNVQDAFPGSGPGRISVYSPTTRRAYTMTCTGSPHKCTGGNGATVYFP